MASTTSQQSSTAFECAISAIANLDEMADRPLDALDVGPVDYVLKCSKGLFSGRFIYVNRTPQGEMFGSDRNSQAITMYIENANLSPKHAEIKYHDRLQHYYLKDAGSETGTFIRLRWDRDREIVVAPSPSPPAGGGASIESSGGGDVPLQVSVGTQSTPTAQVLEVSGHHIVFSLGDVVSEDEAFEDWLAVYKIVHLKEKLSEHSIRSLKEAREYAWGMLVVFHHYLAGLTAAYGQDLQAGVLPEKLERSTALCLTRDEALLMTERTYKDDISTWGLTLSEKTLLRLALMEIFVYKEEGCRPLLLQSAANGRIIAKVPWAGATVHSGKPPVPSPETATQQLVAEETEEERTWNFRIERALALSHGTLTKEGHLLPPKSSAANAQEAAEAEERAGPDEATAMDVLDSAMETAATGGEGGGEGDATTVGSGSAPAGADTEMGTNSPVHPSVEPSNGTADGAPDGSSVVASPTSANTEDTPMQDAQTPGGASKSEDVGDSLASNLSGEGGNNGAGLDLSDSDRPESAGGDTLVDVIMETAERRDGGGLPASGSPISPSSGVEGGVDDGDGVGGRAVEGLLEESPVQADPPDLPASSDPPPVKAAAAPALSEESAAAGPPAGAPSVSVSATTAAGVKEDAEGIDEIMEDAESLKDSSGGATVDSASLQGYTASAAGESSDDHTIIVEKGGEEAEAWEAGLCGPFFVRRTPEPVGWGWWDLVDLGDPQGQNGDPTASSGVVRGTCRWRRKGGGLDMCLALSPHTLCCMGKTWLESQPKHWEIYFDPIHMEESGSSSTAAASSSCSSSQPPSPSSKAAAEPGKKAGGGKDKGGKGGKGGKEKDEDKGFSMKSSLRFSFGPPSESLWTDPEDLSRRLEFLLGGPDWKHQFPLDSLQRVPTPPELNLPSLPPSKEKEKENEGTPARPPHVPAVPIGLFAVRLANQTIIPPSECWLALQKDQDTCLRPGDVFRIGKLEFSVLRFNVGCAGEQGFRQQMEDEDVSLQDMGVAEKRLCSFFAVYDGHGGRTCAEFVRDNLHMKILKRLRGKGGIDSARRAFRFLHGSLLEAFRDTDEAFLRHKELSRPGSGCAAVVVILVGGWIWCANCGDSRAVLCRGGKAVQLSSDHKPDREDELHRISKAGGFVSFRRVLGRLAVSRAFGDFDYKVRTDTQESGRTDQAPLVTSVPEVRVERLQHNDDFLLLACDGLFDVFTSQEAVDFVREGLSKMRKNEQDPQKVVQELIREAIRTRRSRDNVTAILLTFKRSVEPPRTHAASAQQQGGQGQVRK